jgi:hypothetical protein
MRHVVAALLFALALPLSAQEFIGLTVPDVNALDADGNLDFRVTVRNLAPGELFDISVSMSLSPGVVFVKSSGAECAAASDGIRCTLPNMPFQAVTEFHVVAKPPADRGLFTMRILVTGHYAGLSSTASVLARAPMGSPFVVTTTADDGPGSLRQAILDANRDCVSADVSCRISFAIQEPLPERGWYTIEPLSPLPVVGAIHVVIDAKYLNGVPIELRGRHVFSDGLVFHGTFVTLNGLSIDGFFNNGVVMDGSQFLISNDVIGSDPSGTPVPNGLRGIAVVGGDGTSTIRDNLINGNSRSGIFITAPGLLTIVGNRITNNGASGIYIGPAFSRSQIDVQGNVISGNHDFAIGTDANAFRVAVRENAMFDNGAPFDIGMDGPGIRASRLQPAPAITSAVYDAASGDTVVTIYVNPTDILDTYTLYIFANHGVDRAGRAEAEMFLGQVTTEKTATVVFRAHADLRGQILTALTLRSALFEFDTQEVSSELSDGVVVR